MVDKPVGASQLPHGLRVVLGIWDLAPSISGFYLNSTKRLELFKNQPEYPQHLHIRWEVIVIQHIFEIPGELPRDNRPCFFTLCE
jgi:hypothetical protein